MQTADAPVDIFVQNTLGKTTDQSARVFTRDVYLGFVFTLLFSHVNKVTNLGK